MRFYYISIISVFLLLLIWFIGTGLLAWLGSLLKQRWKGAWKLMVPLFLLLYIGPIAEELWIAWNFGRLCKKDAGIVVNKTVEVEGFYNGTRPTHAGARTEAGAKDLDRGGYRFYEMVLKARNVVGEVDRVVHIEKQKGEWIATVLDRPTARHHYLWPDRNVRVSHKIWRSTEEIIDTELRETLAGSARYGRQAPWFYMGLDRPGMSCPRPGEDPLKRPGLLYRQVLLPEKEGE
jgi:hypothetical protein